MDTGFRRYDERRSCRQRRVQAISDYARGLQKHSAQFIAPYLAASFSCTSKANPQNADFRVSPEEVKHRDVLYKRGSASGRDPVISNYVREFQETYGGNALRFRPTPKR